MANIVFMDSFDNYSTGTSHYRWDGGCIITPNGRTGQGASVIYNSSLPKKLFDLRTTLCAGVAIKVTDLLYCPYLQFSNAISGVSASMRIAADGRIFVSLEHSPASVYDYSSTKVRLLANTWFYLEFYVSHTIGGLTYECRINEEVILTGYLGGVNIQAGFTSFQVLDQSGSGTGIIDDVYCTEGEFLGDVRIYVIKPDGDSAPSQWVPSAVGAHYLMVDDTIPNTLDYLSTLNLDDIDMVTLEDISVTGIIKGIQASYIVQKSDAGISMFHGMYNINTTDIESTKDQYLSYMSWIQYYDTYRKNPVTNDDFEIGEINAMTMGVKRIL